MLPETGGWHIGCWNDSRARRISQKCYRPLHYSGVVTGRVSRRGWIVLESIMSTDSMLCVDFFEDPAGGYGFEHFRTDAEDQGGWTAVGRFGSLRFDTPEQAASEAAARVDWLVLERRPREALDNWCSHLGSMR